MSLEKPLLMSRAFLAALSTQMFLHYGNRVPQDGPVLVVSNHRSFMDAPLLMAAVGRSVQFATHHYMGQVPVLREIVEQLGCFPLASMDQRQQSFFKQATQLLQSRRVVGIFPEGAPPMVNATQPQEVGNFERGFAHLALRSPVQDLAVLPVAIASTQETCHNVIPLKLLSWFDPSEPLFKHVGWHPMVVYQRVNILIGKPHWITAAQREAYQGKQAKTLVTELTDDYQSQITALLQHYY